MDTPAAREDMAKVAATMLETKTSFETLSRALTLAQSAEAIGEGLDPNSTDAAVQLNQEEVEHLKGRGCNYPDRSSNLQLFLTTFNGLHGRFACRAKGVVT